MDHQISDNNYHNGERLRSDQLFNKAASRERLLIIGQSTIDDIFREGEGLVFKTAPGGDAIYSTLGASIWPIELAVVSIVGKDYPHDKLTATTCHPELTDWSGLHYYDGPTIHDTAYYYKDGSRKYIFDDEFLLHTLSPKPSDIPAKFHDCKYVHISAANANAQLEVLKFFKQQGAVVSLDVESHFINGYEDVVAEMLALDPIFIPSIEHISILNREPVASPVELWQWVKQTGLSMAVVKCGSDGALLFDGVNNTCWSVGVVPDLHIADTTGAGDAFCGGFMAGYLQTGDPLIAAACGSVSASFIVETWAALRPEHWNLDLATKRLDLVLNQIIKVPLLLD